MLDRPRGAARRMAVSACNVEHLWAPWRMPFIKQAHKKSVGCIFCAAWRTKKDKELFVVGRSKHAVALLNIFPYNNGHMMVAPRRHGPDFDRITGVEWQDIMMLVRDCRKALEKTLAPQGFNVGLNVGRAGGAGIEEHLHVHVVPRWSGDANFMPILAATKVMPQALEESRDLIAEALKEIR